LRVGIPVGLQWAAEVSVLALLALFAGRMGKASSDAQQLVLSLVTLSFTVTVGIGNAAGVRVGWAVGARDTTAARRSGLFGFLAGVSFMALAATPFLLVPAGLAALMSRNEEVIAVVVPLMWVAAFFQLSDGTQGVGAGVLRGAGDTRFAFFVNVIAHYAIGLPLGLYLAFVQGRGLTGLWWGFCTGITLVALSLVLRFLWLSSRTIRPLATVPSE
jgi:MATE family multidrug resistance protein